ncbi:protein kinase [Colletotrichum cuscutae]|uniref:Protein kinase n=1 Tax=Colletotrichum cuscutae TaxID=1209917 RepID=A0AAI9Y944_9PEZI|nr:protein kinase [Colletotrichum cuscutae]
MNRPIEHDSAIATDQTQYLKETCTMKLPFRLSIGNANDVLSPSIPTTRLEETGQNLSLANSRTPTGYRRLNIEDDDISIHTQDDRGYAAAEKVLRRKATIEACHRIVEPAESDFEQIGSQFLPTVPRPTGLSAVTAMARDVSMSLEYYAGIFQGPQWLPVNQLYRIVTEYSVVEALKECVTDVKLSESELEKYSKAVCPTNSLHGGVGSRSMFAILAVLRKVNEIRQFIDLGLSDNDLPFRADPIHSKPDGQLFPKNHTVDHQNLGQTFGRNWDLKDWAAFSKYQTAMRSPFFAIDLSERDRIIPHYELDAETVLPFIEASPVPSSNITYHSMVQRVQIHLHHYTMHKVPGHTRQPAGIEKVSLQLGTCVEENPYFAVKELLPEYGDRQSNEINFREEVRALAKTVGLSSHDHVIKLLATWRRGDKWSMLFPWAKSNLKNYWNQILPRDPRVLFNGYYPKVEALQKVFRRFIEVHQSTQKTSAFMET